MRSDVMRSMRAIIRIRLFIRLFLELKASCYYNSNNTILLSKPGFFLQLKGAPKKGTLDFLVSFVTEACDLQMSYTVLKLCKFVIQRCKVSQNQSNVSQVMPVQGKSSKNRRERAQFAVFGEIFQISESERYALKDFDE